MLNKKSYKFISIFIKIAITLMAFYYIYYKIFVRADYLTISDFFQSVFNKSFFFYLSIVVLLMFLNWLIEAFKWKILIQTIENISVAKSLIAVFCGVTVSIFTPNRVGEIFGRIFMIQSTEKIKTAALTTIGSIAQFMITILCGITSWLFFIKIFYPTDAIANSFLYIIISTFFGISIIAFIWAFINPGVWLFLLNKISFKKEFVDKIISAIEILEKPELFFVMMLSLLRYIVFSIQFYVLLKIFGVYISLFQAAILIPLTFLAITAIPTLAFTELGVRGSASILFIGMISSNHIGIITASFLLWIINVAFPALIGIPFVYRLKFFRD